MDGFAFFLPNKASYFSIADKEQNIFGNSGYCRKRHKDMADYLTDEKQIKIGSKPIIIVNLTPNLSDNEKRERKSDIEQKLYGVFRKYYEKAIEHSD